MRPASTPTFSTGRRCATLLCTLTAVLVGVGVGIIGVAPAPGMMWEDPPDDGLTEAERGRLDELSKRKRSELSDSEKEELDGLIQKMIDKAMIEIEKKEQARDRGGDAPPPGESARPAIGDRQNPRKPPTPGRPVTVQDRKRAAPITRPRPQPQDSAEKPRPAMKRFVPPTMDKQAEVPEGNELLDFRNKRYSFGLKDGSYIDLVEMFARKTGLPVIGLPVKLLDNSKPENDKLTYISAELTDFQTTLHEINNLLFYEVTPALYLFFNEKDNRLQLDAFKEIKAKLPANRLFSSLEAVFEAKARGEFMDSEIVRVFFALKSSEDMKVFNELISNLFGELVLMAPMLNGKIDYLGRVDILEEVQSYLDRVEGLYSEDTLHSLEVKHIKASEALEKLNMLVENIINSADSGGGAPRRRGKDEGMILESEKVLVIANDDLNVLLVRGLPYKVEEVKAYLEVIDREMPGEDPALPVWVVLEHTEAETAEPIVSAVVNRVGRPRIVADRTRGKPQATPRVLASKSDEDLSITAEPRLNALILQGPEELIELAKLVITKFDVPVSARNNVRTVTIEHGEPAKIANLVESLLSDEQRKDRRPLTIEVNDNTLMLSGDPAQMSAAEQLVRELDRERPEAEMKTWVYTLENALPSMVEEVLMGREAVRVGVTASARRQGKGRGKTPPPSVGNFFADDASGKLFYFGTQREWESEILPTVKLFDAEVKVGQHGANFFALTFADPTETASTLAKLFTKGKRASEMQFAATPLGVIVTGVDTSMDLQQVGEAVALLDKDPNDPDAVARRTFAIKFADPEEIEKHIHTLFGSGPPPKGRRGPPDNEAIKTAATSNGIIVIAPTEAMNQIADLIQELDSDEIVETIEPQQFKMEHTEAALAAELLEPILKTKMEDFESRSRGKSSRKPGAALSVQADERTNSVWVSGPQGILEFAGDILKEIDSEIEEQQTIIQVYDCINASAADLVETLTALYGATAAPSPRHQAGKRPRPVRALQDGTSNVEIVALPGDRAMSVSGPPAKVAEVLVRAAEMDAKSSSTESAFRVFHLQFADVDEVANAVIEMIDEPMPRPRAKSEEDSFWKPAGPISGKTISVWPKYESSTLIVHAPPDKMAAVEALISESERIADPGNPEVPKPVPPYEFYFTKYLGAYEALQLTESFIDALYSPKPPVELDYIDKNTLVIKGSHKYIPEIKALIMRYVDTEARRKSDSVISVTTLPTGVPRERLLEMIRQNLPGVDIEMEEPRANEIPTDMIPEIK